MRRFWIIFFVSCVVSGFIFPVSFTFLPMSLSTKMILGVIGVGLWGMKGINAHRMEMSRPVVISGILAIIFSLWCLYSITANGTHDTSYVTYFTSFALWLGGAYGVCALIRHYFDKVDLPLVTAILALVCVFQCVIALMIDNIPFVDRFVNSIFWQAKDYYQRDNRLYGIGAALDPAGVRFSVVLAMIAHQLSSNEDVLRDKRAQTTYTIAFIIIVVVGSMISRTTMVGTALGLGYILVWRFRLRRGGFISRAQVGFAVLLVALITLFAVIGVVMYNSSPAARGYLRFGFEGFFNWVETGEFRTGSTDILKNKMWIWPTDTRGWLIGYGRYGVMEWGSDVGYCLFTLYCGLIGLGIFSIFFIYNHLVLNKRFKNFFIMSLLLIAITFIVWRKVATDIFFIDALLFCMDGDKDEYEEDDDDEDLIDTE